VTFDTQLILSIDINQVESKVAQKPVIFGPFVKRRSGLSSNNRVLLHKQLIRPMMDYVCPT
jgi:hypothetical protein